MSLTEIKDHFHKIQDLESLAKIIGLAVGAWWVYRRFIRTRERHAKIEFETGLRLIGRQDDKLIIEAIATLHNKGLVRHTVSRFSGSVFILQAGDEVVHGDKKTNYQLRLKKHNPEKPPQEPKKKGEKPDPEKQRIEWAPDNWDGTFVDPGIRQQYTYLTQVPPDTTFISVHAKFYYNKKDFHTAQRTFSVQQLEAANNK